MLSLSPVAHMKPLMIMCAGSVEFTTKLLLLWVNAQVPHESNTKISWLRVMTDYLSSPFVRRSFRWIVYTYLGSNEIIAKHASHGR